MLLIALALASAAPFDTKADYVVLAKHFCATKWPDNFEMQGYCLKQQASGMMEFKAVNDELGKPLERALELCTEKWTADRLPNWEMIGYCSRRQAESYKALHRPSSP